MRACHTPGCKNSAPYFVVDGGEHYYLCRDCVTAQDEAIARKYKESL